MNSFEDIVVKSAEIIADANFVCPANKLARELTMIGSKVSVYWRHILNRGFRFQPYSARSGNFVLNS